MHCVLYACSAFNTQRQLSGLHNMFVIYSTVLVALQCESEIDSHLSFISRIHKLPEDSCTLHMCILAQCMKKLL